MKLDKLDTKLLFLLAKKGREPLSSIAKELSSSKPAIKYRIERLEKKGIINGYLPVINPSKLGFFVCTEYVVLQSSSKKSVDEFIQFLQKDTNVTWISFCSGGYDLSFAVYSKDLHSFHSFLKKIKQQFSSIINQSKTSISIEEYSLPCKFLLPNTTTPVSLPTTSHEVSVYSLDSFEKKILQILSKNARSTVVDIARSLKTTVDIVSTRMKRLKKQEVITGFIADINLSTLGYSQFIVHMNIGSCDKKREKMFYAYIKDHKNTTYMIQMLGEWDLSVTIAAKNNIEFNKILLEIRENFADIISIYQTTIILDVLKYTHLPKL